MSDTVIGGTTFYHVTFFKKAGEIIEHGLLPPNSDRHRIWSNNTGKALGSTASIYAFRERETAVLWAAKMQWDFGPAVSKLKPTVGIVEFTDDQSQWRQEGTWVHRGRSFYKRGAVPPSQITGCQVVLQEHIREAISAANFGRIKEGGAGLASPDNPLEGGPAT